MKISYNWLKEFLPGLTLDPDAVADTLTRHSFETEVVGTFGVDPSVLMAKILRLDPHPNANRLRLATVDTGSEEVTVVCGAPNISVGDIVPFSPPGTRLYDEAGKPFTLTPAKIRGVESPGMLNSPRELGLDDEHGGIYVLPSDTSIGSKLADHLPDDTILEADITPNRGHDCLSHRGIARELAAILELAIQEPMLTARDIPPLLDWSLVIEDANDTPAYIGRQVEVTVKASPLWLQARLLALGQRTINSVVDVTNYVMLELGNPTHAFDSRKLPSHTIGVRKAKTGEAVTLLDGSGLTLLHGELVITSNDEAVALAGVMGGVATQVTDATTDIFLEVANFRAYAIWQAAAGLKITTEGSVRWSKGVPVSLAAETAARTLDLLEQTADGKLVGGLEKTPVVAAHTIAFNPNHVSRMAGTSISHATSRKALERVRAKVAGDDPTWQVTVSADRLDLEGEHDLVEEVIRLVGLDTLPARQPLGDPVPLPKRVMVREYIRDQLVHAGFVETYNYSFDDTNFSQSLGVAATTALEVRNPVSPEQRFLRTTLWPRLIEHVLVNKGEVRAASPRGSRNLFEVGHVWQRSENDSEPSRGRVAGVTQAEQIAGVIVDDVNIEGIMRGMFAELGIDETSAANLWRHETLAAQAAAKFKLSRQIELFELQLDDIVSATRADFTHATELPAVPAQYRAGSKYPAALRDLSLLVTADTTIEQVQNVIERVGGELVADVDLFDEYVPEGTNTKGLAFHITYQAGNRTLGSDEINELHNQIVAALQDELGAQLRE